MTEQEQLIELHQQVKELLEVGAKLREALEEIERLMPDYLGGAIARAALSFAPQADGKKGETP